VAEVEYPIPFASVNIVVEYDNQEGSAWDGAKDPMKSKRKSVVL